MLKERNREKRIYEGNTEFIFDAGKTPAVEEFVEAVKAKLDTKEDLILTKYVHH